MSNVARVTVAVSVAAMLAALSCSAMAQQPPNQPPPKKPAVQGQPNRVQGPPGQGPHGGPAQGMQQQFRGPGGPPAGAQFRGPAGAPQGPQFHGPGGPAQGAQFHGPGGPGQFHAAHTVGERGYSFRGGDQGRRVVGTFSERERAVWYGGRWRHEQRFGRYGYWWEVNGAWYYYDQPMDGPPNYVSELEYGDDDLDPNGPAMVDDPGPGGPPVIYAPQPVYIPPPPVVCIGPFCVR
jgi:hypothetical protein